MGPIYGLCKNWCGVPSEGRDSSASSMTKRTHCARKEKRKTMQAAKHSLRQLRKRRHIGPKSREPRTARRETQRASSQVTHLIVYKILQAADLRRNQKRPSKSFRQLTVHSRKATYFIRNLGISCQESKYFLSENWVKINSIFRILSSSPADRHPCWVIWLYSLVSLGAWL